MTPCLICGGPLPVRRCGGQAAMCSDACKAERHRQHQRRYYQQNREKCHAAAARSTAKARQTAEGLARIRRRKREWAANRRWADGVELGYLVAEEVVRAIRGGQA